MLTIFIRNVMVKIETPTPHFVVLLVSDELAEKHLHFFLDIFCFILGTIKIYFRQVTPPIILYVYIAS